MARRFLNYHMLSLYGKGLVKVLLGWEMNMKGTYMYDVHKDYMTTPGSGP